MKRLAKGILTGAMMLSLCAMSVAATDITTENTEVSSKVSMKQGKTTSIQFTREDVTHRNDALRGENVDFSALMEEKQAIRGENVDFSALMEEKQATRGENVDFSALMEEKQAIRGENVDFSALMEEKQAIRGENVDRSALMEEKQELRGETSMTERTSVSKEGFSPEKIAKKA